MMCSGSVRMAVCAVAALVATSGGVAFGQGGQGPPPGAPEAAVPTVGGTTLRWATRDATARNGAAPVAGPVESCGSDRFTFLSELLDHSALDYVVPSHWGDAVAGGKQVMVAGTVQNSSLGTGDLPFDHPFGSDFNMDVGVDPPYADFTQEAGRPSALPMHVELEEGLFPHVRTDAGPATGAEWSAMSDHARENLQPGYFPLPGDRVIVMGRWILDCGHPDYFTELHPLTFMAWSHVDGDKTVVSFFYNPYRVGQRYHPDPVLAPRVNAGLSRGGIFNVDAIQYLIASVNRLQDGGLPPFCCQDHLDIRVLLQALRANPSPVRICAPEGTEGSRLKLDYDIVARPGVRVAPSVQRSAGCATLDLGLGASITPEPVQRTCTDSWEFLEAAAGEEAGGGDPIDIRGELKASIAAQYDSRVDVDPTQSCYDPLSGPVVRENPSGRRLRTRDVAHPMYGRVQVYWAS